MQLFLVIVAIVFLPWVIILLSWIGHSISKAVTLLVKMDFDLRARCSTLYPAYSWNDIDSQGRIAQKSLQNDTAAYDKLTTVKKALGFAGFKPGEPVPKDVELALKANWQAGYECQVEFERYRFKIEGNIRVLNLQSTIQDVQAEYREKLGSLLEWRSAEGAAEKQWDELVAKLNIPG